MKICKQGGKVDNDFVKGRNFGEEEVQDGRINTVVKERNIVI